MTLIANPATDGVMIRLAAPLIALAALAACGNPDFARRMAACEDRGAETLAGVVANPRQEAITRCARSVDAFGVVD